MSGDSTVQCYAKSLDKVSESQWKPCGVGNSTIPFVPCCALGDQCLAHEFCHFAHSKVGGSGYYVSGCTDSSYMGKNCPKICTSHKFPDITWNQTARLWQCCGVDAQTNNLNCNAPTNDQFDAPGPNYIRTYWPPTGKEPKSNTPAIVGGIVGGVIVLLSLVGIPLLWRRRKGRWKNTEDKLAGEFGNDHAVVGSTQKMWLPPPSQPSELQDSPVVVEMEALPLSGTPETQKYGEVAELAGSQPQRDEVMVFPYGVLAGWK